MVCRKICKEIARNHVTSRFLTTPRAVGGKICVLGNALPCLNVRLNTKPFGDQRSTSIIRYLTVNVNTYLANN